MANNHNLKPPWKKGESGNPAGLPKGYKRTSTILAKLLKSKMTVEEAGEKFKKTRQEVMLMKLIVDSMSDKNSASERTRAATAIMDRLEGKPVQPVGQAPEPQVNITISPDEARL